MSDNTTIEWTNATWNPVRGCSLVSAGCTNCYAMRQAHRFSGINVPGGPYKGFTRMTTNGPIWTGKVALVEAALQIPLRWQTPRRIFVNSMSDLFHDQLSDADILSVFEVIRKCAALDKGHVFQILTKRPQRMFEFCSRLRFDPTDQGHLFLDDRGYPFMRFLNNCWLGVSVENQETADERIPWLLKTPAAIRWVSYEPALGPIDFGRYLKPEYTSCQQPDSPMIAELARAAANMHGETYLDWIVVGGESGPNARPFDVQWARNTIMECREAGVACFVKQLGRYPYDGAAEPHTPETALILNDRKGGDVTEWPDDLRIRDYAITIDEGAGRAGIAPRLSHERPPSDA